MKKENFKYENTETKSHLGKKIIRRISIKNGRGYKSIEKFHKGKKISSIKKKIHNAHINSIKIGEFIPGLFIDCKCREKRES